MDGAVSAYGKKYMCTRHAVKKSKRNDGEGHLHYLHFWWKLVEASTSMEAMEASVEVVETSMEALEASMEA